MSTTTITTQNASQRQIMLYFAYLAYCGETITTANPNYATVEETICGYLTGAIAPTISSPLAPITAAQVGLGMWFGALPYIQCRVHMAEAGTQHSDSYAIALGIPNLNAVVNAINKSVNTDYSA